MSALLTRILVAVMWQLARRRHSLSRLSPPYLLGLIPLKLRHKSRSRSRPRRRFRKSSQTKLRGGDGKEVQGTAASNQDPDTPDIEHVEDAAADSEEPDIDDYEKLTLIVAGIQHHVPAEELRSIDVLADTGTLPGQADRSLVDEAAENTYGEKMGRDPGRKSAMAKAMHHLRVNKKVVVSRMVLKRQLYRVENLLQANANALEKLGIPCNGILTQSKPVTKDATSQTDAGTMDSSTQTDDSTTNLRGGHGDGHATTVRMSSTNSKGPAKITSEDSGIIDSPALQVWPRRRQRLPQSHGSSVDGRPSVSNLVSVYESYKKPALPSDTVPDTLKPWTTNMPLRLKKSKSPRGNLVAQTHISGQVCLKAPVSYSMSVEEAKEIRLGQKHSPEEQCTVVTAPIVERGCKTLVRFVDTPSRSLSKRKEFWMSFRRGLQRVAHFRTY